MYFLQAWFFERDDVALPGFHKFFKHASEEEKEHAEKFMKYQNKRGGRIVLQDVQVIICSVLMIIGMIWMFLIYSLFFQFEI